jgi:2-C-methyl-D-erythritol 2,4-cyclodiphosphate synthase
VAEQPRLEPYLDAMSNALGAALGSQPGTVSLKAKTNETMGFIGRGECIAVIAVATLESL